MYNYPVLLTGWKEIANYLHCGVRTAQRWEHGGLPIERPIPGRRSHVVADSEQLDVWLHYSVDWRGNRSDFLSHVQRARKLRAEVRKARKTLREKMAALSREMATVVAAAQRLQRDHRNARIKKAAG